ncbi:MAG: phosphoglucosamine mutase, partial [Clostridium sp.]
FAFDGDADRCLAVDEKGNLINGDFILALCANHLKELGRLKDDTLVVTVMSNLGLDIACKKVGINLEKTKVGDRYVLEEMLEKGYVLGGEQSGHIIFLECNTTGDGLVTALQVASIVRRNKKTLSELCSIMRELPQVLVNATVPNEMKDIYLKDAEIIAEIERMEKLMDGKGRVLIRPSGTEPLVRVMLEGEDQEEIDKLAHNLADMILAKCK